jgi:hypothetical protein
VGRDNGAFKYFLCSKIGKVSIPASTSFLIFDISVVLFLRMGSLMIVLTLGGMKDLCIFEYVV